MNITFILGTIILALIFQKNPTIGIFIIAIYIAYKIPKKKQDVNKKLIKSQEKSTFKLILTIEEGCNKISQTIIETRLQNNEMENDQRSHRDFNKKHYDSNIYRY